MTFNECIENIKKTYDVTLQAKNVATIFINKLLDENNYYFIVLTQKDDKIILTDCSKTFEILRQKELLKEICKKYDFSLNDDEIYLEYKDINDINKFIKLLDILSNNF